MLGNIGKFVIPAKAGIHFDPTTLILGQRLRVFLRDLRVFVVNLLIFPSDNIQP